jgi:conjugative relaxase-like TrwC/TraI family protein
MLRIIPSTSAKAAITYFSDALAKANYYGAGIAPSLWHGKLIGEKLGLVGDVTHEAFVAMVSNLHPSTGERLTPHTKVNRTPGYDLNFNCPKGFSVLQALTGDENLLRVFREAIAETATEIEMQMFTRVRIGKRQEDRLTGNMIAAEIVEFVSRPLDDGFPDAHLHCHLYTMNVTFDPVESRFKAGKFLEIKANAPQHEADFHLLLKNKTRALGYDIEVKKTGWDIADVPESLKAKHSRRGELILAEAKRLGITNAKEKDSLGVTTRNAKGKDLTEAQTLEEWKSRTTADEWLALARVQERRGKPSNSPIITAAMAADFGESKLFEKNSVILKRDLLLEIEKFGNGYFLPSEAREEMARRGYIEREVKGKAMISRMAYVAEEAKLVNLVRSGLGRCAALYPGRLEVKREFLSDEQREALRHILTSRDQVIALRGLAGAGKTTVMAELREILEGDGQRIFAFAQSATASRKVLRDEGFAGADTIARLLVDTQLQQKVRGKIIMIDEAGLVGVRDLLRIMEIAGASTRVILCGDVGQHSPVARGDSLRILEKYSGLPVAVLSEIRRQERNEGYRAAVVALAKGDLRDGFALLDRIGAIREIPNAKERNATLAQEWFKLRAAEGVAPLVVAPTHAEGREVTSAIRGLLQEKGRLKGERQLLQYRDLKFEEAEKGRASNYQPGMVVQFHQNVKGIVRGSILKVVTADNNTGVFVDRGNGQRLRLDLQATSRFQVFEVGRVALARGDLVRLTKNGTDSNGRRLLSGTLQTVKKFNPNGQVVLENGVVLDANHGHLEHGYTQTSHASQGRTSKHVLVAQSGISFGASSREQAYVSISRGKESLQIFTDNVAALQRAVGNTSARLSALEFSGAGEGLFMGGLNGKQWSERLDVYAKQIEAKAATYEAKLAANRGHNPLKKEDGIDFRAYIDERRAKGKDGGRGRAKVKPDAKVSKRSEIQTAVVHQRGTIDSSRIKPEKVEAKKQDSPAKAEARKAEKMKAAKPESRRERYVAEMFEQSKARFKEVFANCKEKAKALKAAGGDMVNLGRVKMSFGKVNGQKAQQAMVESKAKQLQQSPPKPKPPAPAPQPVIRRGR